MQFGGVTWHVTLAQIGIVFTLKGIFRITSAYMEWEKFNYKGEFMMANRKRRQYQIENYSMYDFNTLNIAERQGQEINIAENQITELIMSIKNRSYDEDGVNFIDGLIFLEVGDKVNKTKLKNLLKEGLYIEDKHYVRFIRSSSMARNGTIAFIQDDLYEDMMKLISLGKIDSFGETVISKTESYLGLAFSTTMFINAVPQNICIVDSDKFKTIINDYVKTVRNNEVVQGKHDVEVELFDGQGLHSPEWGKRVAKALGLSDRPAGLQIRFLPSIKGMSYEIDFKAFYKEQGITHISDYTGKMWKVSDLDAIWTTSMFKFSKYFQGWEELKELREKYYTPINQNLIGISAWSCNKDNNTYAKMTYQYLQSLALNSDNLKELSQYTKDLVKDVYSGNYASTMIFLGLLADTNEDDEESIDEETFMATKIHYVLSKNPNMLNDPYIQSFLQRQLAKTIKEMKLGKFYIQGQYSFLCQDPVMMMEMAVDLKAEGSLEKDEFYSTNAEGIYASFRSPLIHSSEVQRMNFVSNEITNRWLSRYKNIIVVNAKDITAQKMGGADLK